MEFSVGDFAEKLLREEADQPVAPSNPHTGFLSPAVNDGPDITRVEVPSDFVSSILEGTDPVIELQPQEKVEVKIEEEPVKEEASDILLEIRNLLLELKSMLNEQTSVGSIGQKRRC